MEIWKGTFKYDLGDYGHEREVAFELRVKFKDGKISGIATDSDFVLLSSLPIPVKGFFEGDHISFVTTFPFKYDQDENGKSFINESEKGHDVNYDGYFNPDVNKWTGDWEILEGEEDEQLFVGGTWELDLPFDSYGETP